MRSAPEQKARPEAVSTTARMSWIRVDGGGGRAQIGDHPAIQGIQSVGPVERHLGDAVSPLE